MAGESRIRRSLFSPLLSAKKNPKRQKLDEIDETEKLIVEARGMSNEKSQREGGEWPAIDVASIHETVLLRVNETLKGCEVGGDSESLVSRLIPALVTAVSVAVGEVVRGVLRDLGENRFVPPSTQRLKAAVVRLTYDNDRLQQYTRRESVRINGIKQEDGETAEQVETKVLKIFADAGVDVKPEDLAAVHRAGKAKKGPRPVLARFVSRRKRREVMQKKKSLKGKHGYDGIYINDDLTPLRARLLAFVKKLDMVDRVWSNDGRIFARKKTPVGLPNENLKPVIIETPDDLFDRLGARLTAEDFVTLGLGHLVDDDEY